MTPKEFAVALLQRLGAPVTTNNVAALVAFEAQEGGHYRNGARFNPLNTTRTMMGARSVNSAGVKAFVDWESGIEATAATIEQQNMRPIWQSLMADAPPNATLKAVTATPWCPQSAPGCASYATRDASWYNNYADIPDPVGGDSPYGYASITTSSGGLTRLSQNPWWLLLAVGGVLAVGGAVAYYLLKRPKLALPKLGVPNFLRLNPVSRRGSRSSRVQSLLLPRSKFSPATAKAWARSHGYRATKVDVTDRYIRLRQAAPGSFARLRTVPFGSGGIKAVVGFGR